MSPWHFLYLRPDPHGHGSFRPIFAIVGSQSSICEPSCQYEAMELSVSSTLRASDDNFPLGWSLIRHFGTSLSVATYQGTSLVWNNSGLRAVKCESTIFAIRTLCSTSFSHST
jgi:hypothetical protein